MSSPTPPDPSPSQPSFDDEDTGPVHVVPPAFDDDTRDSGFAHAGGSWAGRFDTPLTVSPRPVRSGRSRNVLLGAITLAVIVVVGGLIFWMVRPSAETPPSPSAASTTSVSATPDAEAQTRLSRMLPAGYPAGSCKAAGAPKDALAQVTCDNNSDPGGPMSATYTLARNKAALDATFNAVVQTSTRVNCPGNIQSPGPWRRNATPDKTSGILYCGTQDGRPLVAWTDDARLIVNAVQSGPQGPTFDELYAWWSSHS